MLDMFKKSKSEETALEAPPAQSLLSQLKNDYKFKKDTGYSIPVTQPKITPPVLEADAHAHDTELELTPAAPDYTEVDIKLAEYKVEADTAITTKLMLPEEQRKISNILSEATIQDPSLSEVLEYAQVYHIDIEDIEGYQKEYSTNYILAQLKYLESRLEAAQSGTASPIHNTAKWFSMAMPANYANYEDVDALSETEIDLYSYNQDKADCNMLESEIVSIVQEEAPIVQQPQVQAYDESVDVEKDNALLEKTYYPSPKEPVAEKSYMSDCQLLSHDNLILYGVLYGENNKFSTKWHYLKSLSALNFTEYLIDNNMHCTSTFCMYHDVCIHRIQEQPLNRDLCKKGILSNLNTVIPIQ